MKDEAPAWGPSRGGREAPGSHGCVQGAGHASTLRTPAPAHPRMRGPPPPLLAQPRRRPPPPPSRCGDSSSSSTSRSGTRCVTKPCPSSGSSRSCAGRDASAAWAWVQAGPRTRRRQQALRAGASAAGAERPVRVHAQQAPSASPRRPCRSLRPTPVATLDRAASPSTGRQAGRQASRQAGARACLCGIEHVGDAQVAQQVQGRRLHRAAQVEARQQAAGPPRQRGLLQHAQPLQHVLQPDLPRVAWVRGGRRGWTGRNGRACCGLERDGAGWSVDGAGAALHLQPLPVPQAAP